MINFQYKEKIEEATNLINNKKLEEAEKIIKDLIINFPNDFFLENFYGVILLNRKDFKNSEKFLKNSIKNNDKFISSYLNLGIVYYEIKKYNDAINNFSKVLELQSDHLQAVYYIALSYQSLNLQDNAITFLLKYIDLDANNINVYFKIAEIFIAKNDYKNALFFLQRGYGVDKNNFNILILLASCYEKLKDFNSSLVFYNKSLKLKQSIIVYESIARIHKELGFLDLALENYEKCLIIDPNYLPALNNIGTTYLLKKDYFEAVKYFERCLKISRSGNILANMAVAKFLVLNVKEGLNFFEKSIEAEPLAHNYEKYLFNTLYLEDFPQSNYFDLANKFRLSFNNLNICNYEIVDRKENLNIGFVSGDFYDHAVAHQISGFMRSLKNFKGIKTFAYYNNNFEDFKTKELKDAFYKFENIFNLSDSNIIKAIQDDKINILFDLSGYSYKNKLSIFLAKPAPVQISAIGFLQSTGLEEIDYILADKNVIIDESLFVEKILRMPNCWSTLDIRDINYPIKDAPFEKNKFITFGAFNNFQKLNEKTFNLWSKILKKIPNARIFFNNSSFQQKSIKDFIYVQFEKNLISKERIIIGDGGNREVYLKSFNNIDLLLDTYPYGGGTTSLEAAWMCVPILTLTGKNFVSRGATSVNAQLELDRLNSQNEDEYINKAIYFSNNLDELKKIKSHLILNREINNIFNNEIYAQDFYNLMISVWDKYLIQSVKK